MLISRHFWFRSGETVNEVLPSYVAIVFICYSATALVSSQSLLDVSPFPVFYAVIHLNFVQLIKGKALSIRLPAEDSVLGDFFE